MTPYGLCADIHLHAWNKFSGTTENGVNTRLEILLNELGRVATETRAAGGYRVIIAGDLFHVRGSVAPSVLNPAREELRALAVENGMQIIVLAGNHDMEFKNSSEVGNACAAVESDADVVVYNQEFTILGDDSEPDIVMVPWMEDIAELKRAIEFIDLKDRPNMDLIIHAPVNGVIIGIPNTGLDATYLASLGYRAVFAGHYHNHVEFKGNVYSIGAIAHHTWSDVGTKAGFLIVGGNISKPDVKWFASHAPSFVDIHEGMKPEDVELMVDGNYVRAKTGSTKTAELNKLREWLEKSGAKGVLIQHVPEASVTRNGAAKTGEASVSSLEAAVGSFVQNSGLYTPDQQAKINTHCQHILAEASVR